MPAEAVHDRVDVLVARCYAGLPADRFPHEILHRLRRILPVDAAFFATVDPVTMLFTSAVSEEPLLGAAPAFLENEIAGVDVNRFTDLALSADPVGSLDGATAGDRWQSPRYRDLMAPLQLGDELRAALVTGGRCWGVLCLHRQASPSGFTDGELALVRRLGPHLAEAVRRSTRTPADGRTRGTDVPLDRPGPGVLTLGPDGDIVAISPEAEYWLAQLPAGDFVHGTLPVGVLAAVAGSSPVATHPAGAVPAVRLRTRAGEWLSVHVTRVHGTRPLGTTLPDATGATTAVVIQPASPGQMTSLLLAAHGLTPAQQGVAALVLRGLSTREIVRALHISEYTVQEHLRAVFDKFGVGSRRALIAALLA